MENLINPIFSFLGQLKTKFEVYFLFLGDMKRLLIAYDYLV
jgi:hypothetical protein